MDRIFGNYIAAGLMIGSAVGLMWGPMLGNIALGIGIGALVGLSIGWFAAAATLNSGKPEGGKPDQNAGGPTTPGASGENSHR